MERKEVWYPLGGSYERGFVVGPSGKSGFVVVKTLQNQQVEVLEKDTEAVIPSTLSDVDDMIHLDAISEAIILHNLRQRYDRDVVYTYIGPMIISVNPFKTLPHYGEYLIGQYYQAQNRGDLPPHLYSVATSAFRSMMAGTSQNIIISGESGAGKTEATKIILKFLCVVADQNFATENEISRAILASNPILEAFGNAKTVRNNNSSRFGKFITILFSREGKIVGAKIHNYLLENTRVVLQSPEERNYHIFYQMLNGASPEERRELLLDKGPYHYLSNGNIQAPGIDDIQCWKTTRHAFKTLNVKEEEQMQILKVLSAILCLGNIKFQGQDQVRIENREQIGKIAALLQLENSVVEQCLTVKFLSGGGRQSTYGIPLTYQQAIENRDALAKALYSNLFDYLVNRLNTVLTGKGTSEDDKFIGVLDIYGFEVFTKNSLEQFCINYANEKLHAQFNLSLFQAEQEEYLKEGIEWNKIDITGNAGCIDMIENKSSGLLSLLNEECQLPQGNENSLIQKYNNHHTKNKNIYKYDPRKRSEFQVNHYAGNVIYTIDGFIDKNKNTLNADVCKALCNSTSFLVKALFQEESELDQPNKLVPQGRVSNHKNLRRPGSTNKTTVTQKFQRELISLVEFLQNGQSHYVRTIKPNQTKEPRKFESEKVNHQLKCNGVTETVKLRKAGFAQRFTPQSFFNLYKGLGMSNEGEVSSFLKQFGGDGWVKGKTKIFVKLEVLDKLERKRMEIFKNNLLVIQKFVRRHNAIHLMLEKRDLEGKRREEVIRKKKEEEETTKRIKEEKERKEKEVLLARQEAAKKKREEEERRDKAERERIEAQRLLFQKQQEEREKSIAAEKEKARRLEQEQERRRKEVMRHSLRLEELKTERDKSIKDRILKFQNNSSQTVGPKPREPVLNKGQFSQLKKKFDTEEPAAPPPLKEEEVNKVDEEFLIQEQKREKEIKDLEDTINELMKIEDLMKTEINTPLPASLTGDIYMPETFNMEEISAPSKMKDQSMNIKPFGSTGIDSVVDEVLAKISKEATNLDQRSSIMIKGYDVKMLEAMRELEVDIPGISNLSHLNSRMYTPKSPPRPKDSDFERAMAEVHQQMLEEGYFRDPTKPLPDFFGNDKDFQRALSEVLQQPL